MSSLLFTILGGIIESDHRDDTLSNSDDVINYAEVSGVDLSYEDAQRIIEVGRRWLHEIDQGNGEWDRMREEARQALDV